MWHQQLTHSISNRSKQDGLLFTACLLAINSPQGISNTTSKEILCRQQHKVSRCTDKAHWLVFFWLPCSGHSMMALPGYINKNASICHTAEKNGPLCLTVKLLTCSVALCRQQLWCQCALLLKEQPVVLCNSDVLLGCFVMAWTQKKTKPNFFNLSG